MTVCKHWKLMGVLVLAGCTSAKTGTPKQSPWQARAEIPYRVQEIYPALHRGRIYVAGGFVVGASGQLGISKQTSIYDPSSDEWSPGPQLPEPRHHPFLVSTGQRLYAFGGFVATAGGGWSASKDVLRLDEAAGQWRKVAELLHAQSEPAGAYLNGKIYLVTGRAPKGSSNATWNDHADIDSMQVFDPATQTVTAGIKAPSARNSAAGAVIDGRLYVVGGRVVNDGNRAATEVFDPHDGSWRTLSPMPNAQGGLAAAVLDGKLYAFGGEFFGPGGGGVHPECWVYDPRADKWSSIPAMPVPRHGLGAVTIGDAIYVIGGAARAGGEATTNRLSVFRPS